MTDTTEQLKARGPKSPEFHLVREAFGGLREALFHDAFAYRLLPPRTTEGRLARLLPRRIRAYAVWTPHALVVAAALITLSLAYNVGYGTDAVAHLLTGFIPAAAVLMTLVRPVGAFWVSLVSTPFTAVLGNTWDGWPWTPAAFFAHIVVMVVVAARTGPRTALWMWLATAAYGVVTEVWVGSPGASDAPMMLFVSALALLVTTVVHVRREAQREVTVQRTVTAIERDKRTLLEERTNIARELHDVVAHHMSVVAIQAEAAPYRVENPPPELEQAFVTIRENAVSALTELRRVLGVVRAEDYEAPDAPQPTLADLDRLLDNVRDAGLTVDKVVTGAVRELPQGVELSAYRIVQEALSNSLRHAPGAAARVEVGYVLGGLGLRVVNGPATGLVKPSPGAGHGITGMRERVTMLNGEMTAEPAADGGYEVTVFLPVPPVDRMDPAGEDA
ncbi:MULTISPECIES: histidine kinase [unclassified Streptomyces]|uniref:histidine kinase n=1 Tax=unclassified Streptomyces TaxID=2593676 RepID=UPI0013690858|nr:two-component sensor histidine kinase [Streptomyces sp. SID335]MYZ15149.1 two-component sensor histidine kinase [Streptomyces sp. SID337]NDZ98909.1 two-component sensor histidine kinase [Streptomyces sp. SID10116]NEB47249.1 two-component sensor histidine kinase [Streptomyces sp. SID339]